MTICNGELYNWKELAKEYDFEHLLTSSSDSEILPHLIHKLGLEKTCSLLDGVFAFCVINQNEKKILVGRDTFGVRPMFYAVNDKEMIISSLLKGIPPHLLVLATQFPPSYCCEFNYSLDHISEFSFIRWNKLLEKANSVTNIQFPPDAALDYFAGNIKELLIDAVRKRLMSDRPICCLLSGGLDSSLVTSIVCRLSPGQKIKTFTLGLPGSVDLIYARKVADFLGTDHYEVNVSKNDMLKEIPNTVWELETYDTITIRSGTANFLVSKYIAENSECVVALNGEGSDEVFMSYLYSKKAPSPSDFHKESVRLLDNIHYFDVLRSDRSTSGNGLEARVPFLDKKFVEYVLLQTPIHYRQHPTIEKHILRYAFDCKDNPFLPSDVLWRQKEGFSDGISSEDDSWHNCIKNHVSNLNLIVSDDKRKEIKSDGTVSDEAVWYYDMFQSHFEGCSTAVPYFWLPRWCGNIKDPSARCLDVYNA